MTNGNGIHLFDSQKVAYSGDKILQRLFLRFKMKSLEKGEHSRR